MHEAISTLCGAATIVTAGACVTVVYEGAAALCSARRGMRREPGMFRVWAARRDGAIATIVAGFGVGWICALCALGWRLASGG